MRALSVGYIASVIKSGGTQSGSGAVSVPIRIPRIGWLGLAVGGTRTTVTPPTMLEHVSIQLSADALAQPGAAQKIEFKTCNDERRWRVRSVSRQRMSWPAWFASNQTAREVILRSGELIELEPWRNKRSGMFSA